MTTFDLRTLRIRSGDQARERVDIELEPLVLGGQTYEPEPNPAPAERVDCALGEHHVRPGRLSCCRDVASRVPEALTSDRGRGAY